ncbi:TetR/AcrR family transcriptional regulator [Sinimarinibacterium thermocellulolyticum]|uniref:TetR/AcrR family transcriptional regulator n=1 Tax=Sinimarinibacterium thermocellulolyticum TaxID=3170016 RepID=A0ABV2AC96_9GAMM
MARPESSAQDRQRMRERMIDAARRLYLDRGAEALSLRTLADALGISHTLPYRYFGNKQALLAQLRRDAVERFHAWVLERDPAGADPLTRLRALFDAYLGFARRHPPEYRLIFASDQPPPDRYPELLAARERMFDFAMDVVQDCIDAGLVQGDAREIAHAYWISLHGLMTLHVAHQLVHGCRFEQLAPALLERLLGPLGTSNAGRSRTRKAAKEQRR